MKHRLDLLQTDPAYRFDLSPSKASQIVITRTELMLREIQMLLLLETLGSLIGSPIFK